MLLHPPYTPRKLDAGDCVICSTPLCQDHEPDWSCPFCDGEGRNETSLVFNPQDRDIDDDEMGIPLNPVPGPCRPCDGTGIGWENPDAPPWKDHCWPCYRSEEERDHVETGGR